MAKHKKRILQTFSVTGSLQKTKNYFKKNKKYDYSYEYFIWAQFYLSL